MAFTVSSFKVLIINKSFRIKSVKTNEAINVFNTLILTFFKSLKSLLIMKFLKLMRF